MDGHSRSKNGVASLAYVPAIHVFDAARCKTWMPGTRPGMTSPCLCVSILGLDAVLADDRGPLVDLGLELGGERLRGRADHHDAELFELVLERRLGQECGGVRVHPGDDRRRRFCRHEEAIPGRDVEDGHAG